MIFAYDLTLCQYFDKLFIIFNILKNLLLINTSKHNMIYSAFALYALISWHPNHLTLNLSYSLHFVNTRNRPLCTSFVNTRNRPLCTSCVLSRNRPLCTFFLLVYFSTPQFFVAFGKEKQLPSQGEPLSGLMILDLIHQSRLQRLNQRFCRLHG